MRPLSTFNKPILRFLKFPIFLRIFVCFGGICLVFYLVNVDGQEKHVSVQEDIKQISVIRSGDTLVVQGLDIRNTLSKENVGEDITAIVENINRTGKRHDNFSKSLTLETIDSFRNKSGTFWQEQLGQDGRQDKSGRVDKVDNLLIESLTFKTVRVHNGQARNLEEENKNDQGDVRKSLNSSISDATLLAIQELDSDGNLIKSTKSGNITEINETNNGSGHAMHQKFNLDSNINSKMPREHVNTYVTQTTNESYSTENKAVFRKPRTLLDEVELYLRMNSDKLFLYQRLVVQSMWYFWPSPANMVVVLDGENRIDRSFGMNLSLAYPFPRVEYMDPIDPEIYYHNGHERMQRDFFYPERHVTKKYVGYIDTDTMFITTVTPDLLFENGKPVVVALYGYETDEFWINNTITTSRAFKRKEVMRCMTYFPVIIRVDHIVELRHYIEKLHNDTFDNIFHIFDKANLFGQFNLMCQYIWMYHRNEYSFHLEYFDGRDFGMSPGRIRKDYYKDILKPEETYPFPRSSIHFRYLTYDDWTSSKAYRNALKSGICYSGGFEVCPDSCKEFDRNGVQKELFSFELHNWLWDKRCIDSQKRHYRNVREKSNSDSAKLLRRACREVDELYYDVNEPMDWKYWTQMEKLAQEPLFKQITPTPKVTCTTNNATKYNETSNQIQSNPSIESSLSVAEQKNA